jgi:hypothetical protein
MITCVYTGNNTALLQAVKLANQTFSDPSLYAAIAEYQQFTNTEATAAQIAQAVRDCNVKLLIVTYKPRNPWSRVIGHFNEHEPDKIYLNVRRLDRAEIDIAGTIIHEAIHAADATSPLEFGHEGNRPGGNENSAPYWIGNWAIWKLKGAVGPIVAFAHGAEDEGQALA